MVVNWRTRGRSKGSDSRTASARPLSHRPTHTVPGSAPSCGSGPAAPVVARPTSQPSRPHTRSARPSAISSLTAATSGAPTTPVFTDRS